MDADAWIGDGIPVGPNDISGRWLNCKGADVDTSSTIMAGERESSEAVFEVRDFQPLFNPASRLVSLQLQVRLRGGQSAPVLGAWRFEGEPVTNAWVLVTALEDRWFWLSADAVLPDAVAPQSLTLVIEAPDHGAMTLPVPDELPEEVAGLISAELEGGRLVVDGWRMDGAMRLQSGTEILDLGQIGTATVEQGRSIERVRGLAKWPPKRWTLKALPPDGARGQNMGGMQGWFTERWASSPRLLGMKDAYRGKTAWLIGNGPSVRPEDLDRLADHVTFSFNRFYLAHEQTRLRSTFTVSGDRQMIEDWGQEIVDQSEGQVFLAHESAPDVVGDYIWVRQKNCTPTLFSRFPANVVTPGGSSLFVAMQIGYWLGIRKFILYGADFSFNLSPATDATDAYRSVTGDGNHFIKNYRSGKAWCPPAFRNITSGFLAARILMESEGGFVVNATRGGLLNIFPRVAFDDAIQI